jgi:predicted transcriptional regulator
MILDADSWMNIRRFRALRDAGATYAEIAAEVGCDWRTVKKYLAPGAESAPPRATSRRGKHLATVWYPQVTGHIRCCA